MSVSQDVSIFSLTHKTVSEGAAELNVTHGAVRAIPITGISAKAAIIGSRSKAVIAAAVPLSVMSTVVRMPSRPPRKDCGTVMLFSSERDEAD